MTEAEWLVSDDPAAMLEWAANRERYQSVTQRSGPHGMWPPASDRKLRLFACAFYRSAVNSGNIGRKAAEDCERWAETGIMPKGWEDMDEIGPAKHAKAALDWANGWNRKAVYVAARAALLRDICGNPWRPVKLPKIAVCPAAMMPDGKWVRRRADGQYESADVCPWLTPTVVALARAAYDERGNTGLLDPVRLAILADALEDAGCSDEAMLRHLRGWERCWIDHESLGLECNGEWKPLRSPHVRGCWAVDLILGKS